MSPRTLHLLRHGAPARTGLLLGRTDSPVTPEGVAACRVRGFDIDFTHVVTSDLARARACAETLAADKRLGAAVDPRWRELDFGAWDGHDPADLAPDALARFWQDPEASPPPEGEPWSALVARVQAALDDLPREPTLVVTHGGAIRAALHVLCGFAQPQCAAFHLPYAARITLRLWPDGAQIAGLAT